MAEPALDRSGVVPLLARVGTTASLADWSDMNTTNPVPDTPAVGPPPLVVDPVAPSEPIKPVPKPSPEGTSEFWRHVIR
jgi:hypothetical protein